MKWCKIHLVPGTSHFGENSRNNVGGGPTHLQLPEQMRNCHILYSYMAVSHLLDCINFVNKRKCFFQKFSGPHVRHQTSESFYEPWINVVSHSNFPGQFSKSECVFCHSHWFRRCVTKTMNIVRNQLPIVKKQAGPERKPANVFCTFF